MNRLFRLIAFSGVLVVLLVRGYQSLPLQPRQGYSLAVLVVATLCVGLTFAVLLPRQLAQLLRHPNLLVPLGLLILFDAALGWLASLAVFANVFGPSTKIEILKLSFALSVSFVLSILANVAYAAWVTMIVLNVTILGDDKLAAGLRGLRWFGRVFLVLLIGWGAIFAVTAVALFFATASILLALLLIGVFSLVWNLFTVALLLAALDPRLDAFSAIARGFRASRAGLGRWWGVVLVQLLLLGFVTLVHVSFTATKTEQRGGTTHTTTQHQTKTNWSVNGFWVGGYENDCRWHGAWMSAVEAPPLAPVTTLLSLLFGVLAIGVKLRVARNLFPPEYAPVAAPVTPDVPQAAEYADVVASPEP